MNSHQFFNRSPEPAAGPEHGLFLTTIICLSGLARLAHGADAIDLHTALSMADVTPQVERSRAQAAEAAWGRVETYGGFLPNIQLSSSYLFERKYVFTDIDFGGRPASVPGVIPRTNYALSLNWPIFDGFANINRYQAGRLNEQASNSDLDWTRFQTERSIILAFYQALSWKELREVAEQNLKTLQEHLDDVQLLKKTGVGTNYDVLRVEVQMSEARTELLNAQDEEELSLKRFFETLGKAPESATSIAGQLPVVSVAPSDLEKLDSRNRADLVAQGYRVDASAEASSAAAKHWFPKLALFGNFQHYNNRGDSLWDSKEFRDAYTLGLQLSWNLFDGLAANARAHQAAEKRIQNENSLEISRLRASNELENGRRKFRYYSEVFKARSSDVNKATESVRLARVGRKAGVRTTNDLLDAELELFRARAGVVRSQVGMIESLISLERASGTRLYQFQ